MTLQEDPAANKRILVADDDPAIGHSIKMLLEDEGYVVETTADGETVRAIKDNLPHLILLDIWMSGMDGRDVAMHLKTQPATTGIPIIMISANRDIKKIATDYGADDFLAKPFDIDDLLKKIAFHLAASD